MVNLGHQRSLTQIAFALGRLFGQYVAGKSLVATNFTGAGLAETLGGSTVGFNLGHGNVLLGIMTRHPEPLPEHHGYSRYHPVIMLTGI